jgi:hypothetical protein
VDGTAIGVGLGGVAWGLAVPAACLLREEVAYGRTNPRRVG